MGVLQKLVRSFTVLASNRLKFLAKINSQKFKTIETFISRQELTWAALKNGSNEVEQSRQIEKDVTISKLHFA